MQAEVNYRDRNLAKEKGFTWNARSKRWELEMKEYDKQDITDELNFAYSVLS